MDAERFVEKTFLHLSWVVTSGKCFCLFEISCVETNNEHLNSLIPLQAFLDTSWRHLHTRYWWTSKTVLNSHNEQCPYFVTVVYLLFSRLYMYYMLYSTRNNVEFYWKLCFCYWYACIQSMYLFSYREGHQLANWLIESKIIEHIFGPNLHIEVSISVIKVNHVPM